MNFDERNKRHIDIIVCIRQHRRLTSKENRQQKEHIWTIWAELSDLLDCVATTVSEVDLKRAFPVTYNETLSSHKWESGNRRRVIKT